MDPKRLTDLRISEVKAIVAEKPLILIPIRYHRMARGAPALGCG